MLRPVVSRSACFATMTALHGTGKLTDRPFVIISQSSAALVPRIRFSHTTQLHLSHTYSPGAGPWRGCPARAWKQPAAPCSLCKSYGSAKAPQRSFLLHHRDGVRIGPACRGVTSPPKNTTLLSRADRASLSRSYERPVRPGPSSQAPSL